MTCARPSTSKAGRCSRGKSAAIGPRSSRWSASRSTARSCRCSPTSPQPSAAPPGTRQTACSASDPRRCTAPGCSSCRTRVGGMRISLTTRCWRLSGACGDSWKTGGGADPRRSVPPLLPPLPLPPPPSPSHPPPFLLFRRRTCRLGNPGQEVVIPILVHHLEVVADGAGRDQAIGAERTVNPARLRKRYRSMA